VAYLSHKASFHSNEWIAPSNPGIKHLDPAAANDLVAVLRETAAAGTALLVSTHDIFRAKDVATRIAIMRHGRLVETVDPAALSGPELESLYLTHMAEGTA
jgi:ABC-2 type transport system ATP-binding protein